MTAPRPDGIDWDAPEAMALASHLPSRQSRRPAALGDHPELLARLLTR